MLRWPERLLFTNIAEHALQLCTLNVNATDHVLLQVSQTLSALRQLDTLEFRNDIPSSLNRDRARRIGVPA